ncbi:DUF2442 domain-containing protein [Hymenobacter sp. IS2118]|uniref:DUF2442 domain-containing protein n=1 Tax=Hymenobacter sp. IS2118 TaxID=1505605 RepID=UPI00069100D0|nr:DUF2442 domain-containing protein [Hymenobacter sp. IS2118]
MRITETAVAEVPAETMVVVAAELVGPHTLALMFSNGTRQTVDFGPFLRRAAHPAIKAYLNEARFGEFEIVNGNVNWNDYDLIFPVADLYAGEIR